MAATAESGRLVTVIWMLTSRDVSWTRRKGDTPMPLQTPRKPGPREPGKFGEGVRCLSGVLGSGFMRRGD
jgi:hypothetical protein